MASENSIENPKGASLGLFDVAICIYLALPSLVFCSWFKPPIAALLALALAYGAYQTLKGTEWRRTNLSRAPLAWLALLSLAWVSLGGAGHFFYANFDWFTRDAILRDLSLAGWPPSYPTTDAAPLILRAPLGYYLPAALVGTWGGIQAADIALWLWTSVGFFLLLGAAVTMFATSRQRVICTILVVGFSGMDLAGYALTRGTLPRVTEHIEWWAGFAQYSANSTLLFWVPNHALPAWLTTILILRHWRQPALARIAPLLGSCVPLWSPLAALGTLPFFLAGIDWRRDLASLLSQRALLPLATVALVSARYLTAGAEHIPSGWLFAYADQGNQVLNLYLLLCLLEFGLLCMVLARLRSFDLRVAIAAIVLCLLPLYKFGYGNDIVMRASIPALLVLAMATVRPLTSSGPLAWRGTLGAILAIGGMGAMQEPLRAVLWPRWEPTGLSLVEVAERITRERGESALPTTYVTHLRQPDLRSMLRAPSPVLGTPTPDRGTSAAGNDGRAADAATKQP